MSQFVLLFVGRTAAADAEDPETVAYAAKWMDWMGGLARSGALRSGAPFAAGGQLVGQEGATPLNIEPVDIGGYAVIEADSVDAAVEMAKQAPHTELGGTTIVRPCLPVGPPQ